MKVSDFDYDLPGERIAQEPVRPRDAARLFVHEVSTGVSRHRRVRELADELAEGDLLVLNDTRVLPARLFARRATGGAVELLFLAEIEGAGGAWRAMVRPAKRPAAGEELAVEGTDLVVRMLERERAEGAAGGPFWSVELSDRARPDRDVRELLESAGRMPLPPYIRRERENDLHAEQDRERYQTVYAERAGAVAAPTAGLHFTAELLGELARRGIERTSLTLHVGLGTFLPVTAEDTGAHVMHAERYELGQESARAVGRCRERGGRVVAVGTTSVRVLETCALDDGALHPGAGHTDLFITPGHRFRCVDALLTNFHLPRSTLLMLVSALCGRERILCLYREAVERGYRFYSYGDAMLLLP